MCSTRYFYPRSPCGERRVTVLGVQLKVGISIHALLAESDVYWYSYASTPAISIHALLAESDSWPRPWLLPDCYFYPRSPCGERRSTYRHQGRQNPISIHALLAESDYQIFDDTSGATGHFYPRSPCGERPGSSSCARAASNFYPRSPCGERLLKSWPDRVTFTFLSTLSLRRATQKLRLTLSSGWYFYPRSPCGERRGNRPPCPAGGNFYPRSPCGERRIHRLLHRDPVHISIHALLAESDITLPT